MIFPTLYKKTSTGAIQTWQISVENNEITTTFGQLNTPNPQKTLEIISKGKNIGKSNETSPEQQALLEANATYSKKLKGGYVNSLEGAQQDQVDASIEGGILPMLAHVFAKQGDKINYPAICQPKLDGLRLLAIMENGKCTLWSRTRKPILGIPHIARAIEKAFPGESIVLDGEAYQHDYKRDFEKIVSFVKQEEPKPGHEIVQYHIYDLPNDKPQDERTATLSAMDVSEPLVIVDSVLVYNEEELMACFEKFISQGYEGAMVRNIKGKYVNKRSYDLQKIKEFDDSEFQIVGIEEGKGKLAGHAIFVCMTAEGKEFKAKMKGETAKLKAYFDHHSLWKGKQLVVKYQGFTAYGIPRFPVGIRIHSGL